VGRGAVVTEQRNHPAVIDRRTLVVGGAAVAAGAIVGAPGAALAHEDGHGLAYVICATVGEHISPTAMNARAIPTDRQFRVDLLPGARIANAAGTAHRLEHFRPGDSIAIVLPEPAPVDAATVGDDGPIAAAGVVQLKIGTRSQIADRDDG